MFKPGSDASRTLQGLYLVAQELAFLSAPIRRVEPLDSSLLNVRARRRRRRRPKLDPQPPPPVTFTGNQNPVPETPLKRAIGFASLGASLAFSSFKDVASGRSASSEASADLLASALCRMRGAALKLGQVLSIQDLPEPLQKALEKARANADRMPDSQLYGAIEAELGHDWRRKLIYLDPNPIATASLGQVHAGTYFDENTKTKSNVAVKIQYPGVSESIESDVGNLRLLANLTNVFPKGLFIDNVLDNMLKELKAECDYTREARNQIAFKTLIEEFDGLDVEDFDAKGYYVPKVYEEASTAKLLITELIQDGMHLDEVATLGRNVRNSVGRRMLQLTLVELFDFKFMQTDPSFANFLYLPKTDEIVLIDFGACNSFSDKFVSTYSELVLAASNQDRDGVLKRSLDLGMIDGFESDEFLRAHVDSALDVGKPFRREEPYDFHESSVSQDVSKKGSVYLRDRRLPPPEEIYSLHRKLSGAYLACVRIKATFEGRSVLKRAVERVRAKTLERDASAFREDVK